MKPKTTILLILALGSGLVAAFMTNKLIADRSKAPEGDRVMALVVKEGKNIQAQTWITKPDDFFEAVEKPADAVPKNYIADVTDKDLKDGFRVARKISAGNYLTRDDLIAKGSNGIEVVVPKGKVAITIKCSRDQLVGGFVLPSSKVDVLWTYKGAGEPFTQTIFQDMQVLAVDTITTRNPDAGQSILGQDVTIAVRPEEAQHFTLAASTGEIRLTVRSVQDEGRKVQIRAARLSDLGRGIKDVPPDSSDSTADTVAMAGTTTGGALVPMIPSLPPAVVATMPETAPATPMPMPVPEEKPTPPARDIHVVEFVKGDGSSEAHGYVFDKEKNKWQSVGSETPTRTELEPKGEPKRPEAPAPGERKEDGPGGK